jgi:uncharacterized RDD family membrane protein YckC
VAIQQQASDCVGADVSVEQHAVAGDLTPAGIVRRAAVGMLDGGMTTTLALAIAWAVGVLPTAHETMLIGRAALSPTTVLRSWHLLSIASQVGGTLAIRIGVVFVYDTVSVALGGQTLACRLLRLRIVTVEGSAVPLAQSLRRAAAGGLITQAPVVGQLLRAGDYGAALLGKQKRALRDRVAGTALVHARSAVSRS